MRQYNSCGPINIEYPEYITKVPAFASGYLKDDVVRFDCFQTHWIHGDNEYKCGIVDYNDPRNYRFEWNKGNQPWCRFREMENFLKYLAAILAVVFSLMVLIFIFLACWCIKQKRLGAVFETRPIPPTSVSPPFDRKYENEGFAVPPPPEGIAPGPMSPANRVSSPAPTELRQRAPGAAEEQFVGMNTSHMLPSLLEVVEENSTQFTTEIRQSWTTLFDVIANLIDIFRASESKALHARHQH